MDLKKLKQIVSVAAIVLLALVLLVGLIMVSQDKKAAPAAVEVPEEIQEVLESPELEETGTVELRFEIAEVGELVTAEYDFTRVKELEKEAREFLSIKLPFTESRFVYGYDGTVKAGIDFGEIEILVDDVARCVQVTLPKPRLMGTVIDFDSLVVYTEDQSAFNTISLRDVGRSQQELVEEAEAAALERGLLDRATENARAQLTALLLSTIHATSGAEDYQLIFAN